MSLQIGVDSYVTLEEAGDYVSKMYVPDSQQYIKWTGMADASKEVILRQSCRSIDFLRYSGEKLKYGQTLQFQESKGTLQDMVQDFS